MTAPPKDRRAPQPGIIDLETALDALRDDGLRITAPRRAVVELLLSAAQPMTADELLEAATERLGTIAPSTVYRVLATLEEQGIVAHVHHGHGAASYAVGAGGIDVVCEGCGEVARLTERDLRDLSGSLHRRYGFELGVQHFALTGRCARCAAPVLP